MKTIEFTVFFDYCSCTIMFVSVGDITSIAGDDGCQESLSDKETRDKKYIEIMKAQQFGTCTHL